MKIWFFASCLLAIFTFGLLDGSAGAADDAKPASTPEQTVSAEPSTAAKPTSSTEAKPTTTSSGSVSHETVLKEAKSIEGLIPLYRKDNRLYAELSSGHFQDEYLVLIAIARGIGQRPLLGGYSWGLGDDWVWSFRKVDKNVHIIRRNVRFKAQGGTPEARAVKNAFTDSVIFSLPVITKGPKGGDLIDLSPVFLSDLPQISQVLPGFSFSGDKTTWGAVKGFEKNVELQVAAVYSSGGRVDLDTVPDSRGAQVIVHYSISKIPSTGYKPRRADPRVGYFITAVKDFSQKDSEDQFARYINRWHLEKADSAAEKSPPKVPLVFWIEKTVPFEYRKPIRDGIAEWNKAFEQAGFIDAIEVRQQPDDADWDPEDINYNTFRWITANAGFAMGPSRVNPYTGQILDADVIFDADFLTFWKQELETLTPDAHAAMTGLVTDVDHLDLRRATIGDLLGHRDAHCTCLLSHGQALQFALGSAAIMAEADPAKAAARERELIMQGLKEVTMHEVGHTLGLRHNFKGSVYRSLSEINDPAKTRDAGMVASIMDYVPANIVPQGTTQGDYYPTTIGPYDIWAIEYGYKQFSGSEEEELKKIASRSGEPALKYATDEDTLGITDADPESNRYDLGNDALAYAQQRAELMQQLIPKLAERSVQEGEDYTKARKALNVILAEYGQAMQFASRYIGGIYLSRSFKGDKDAPPPFVIVEAKKQRDALALLEQQVLSDQPFQFPPALYNQLATSNWRHWGADILLRKDFAVHDVILMWQERILGQVTSSVTLKRIHDAELKIPADQDAFTTAELLDRLTTAVFAEVKQVKDGNYSERKPAISSLRRNLQRSYLKTLANIALGRSAAPEDCQTIAFVKLGALRDDIDKLLASKVKLDAYSHAHLRESSARIEKVLEARLTLSSP
jgi:hypothetical protein